MGRIVSALLRLLRLLAHEDVGGPDRLETDLAASIHPGSMLGIWLCNAIATARPPSSGATRWTACPWPPNRKQVSHDPGAS